MFSFEKSTNNEMDRWRRFMSSIIFLFLFLILFIFTLNFIVDPYNFNMFFKLGIEKENISKPMNYRLYSLAKFNSKPRTNIVLGDSRGLSLKEEYFEKAGAGNWSNMSIGGGSLYEEIDLFYYIIDKVKLKTVVFLIPFNIYNDNQRRNEIPNTIATIESPFRYYISTFITRVSLLILYSNITGYDLEIGKPNMTKEEFWRYQLGPNETGNVYSQWSYPKNLIGQLYNVRTICKQRGINMIILLPPTHVDLQLILNDYGLEKEYIQYKRNLSFIAPVIDYDFPNDLTSNRNLFNDPYHYVDEIGRSIVFEILGKHCQYCRKYVNSQQISP
jgi:hypothetical protein